VDQQPFRQLRRRNSFRCVSLSQDFATNNDDLPAGLFNEPDDWVEIDFHRPHIHEDFYGRVIRLITLHARAYRGRSYLPDLLSLSRRQAAQNGFILLKAGTPQIPIETEVTLVQFMILREEERRPTPTKIVWSIRHRRYRNVDGSSAPLTNTGVGIPVREYTLKRRLLFEGLQRGGLAREPDLTQ